MARPALPRSSSRLRGGLARGLFVVLLPLWLVLAQQGALLHELGHQIAGDAVEHHHPQHGQAPCPLCQVFAQVSDLVGAVPAPTVPAPALRFHHAPAAEVATRSAAVPAQRSRGPPVMA